MVESGRKDENLLYRLNSDVRFKTEFKYHVLGEIFKSREKVYLLVLCFFLSTKTLPKIESLLKCK